MQSIAHNYLHAYHLENDMGVKSTERTEDIESDGAKEEIELLLGDGENESR